MINMTHSDIFKFFTEDSVFRASRSLNFQKIFWPLRANDGGPSVDINLSANLTNKNFEVGDYGHNMFIHKTISSKASLVIANSKRIGVIKFRNYLPSGNLQRQPQRGVLGKKMVLEISQNLQENSCARVSGLQLY